MIMSTKQPLIIVGAGGHAAVVADALLAAGEAVLGFTDADPALHGRTLCGLPVLGDDSALAAYAPQAVALVNGIGSIGGEPLRREVQQRLAAQGWQFAAVRHPSALVSPFARLGTATQLLAGCIVQPGAGIGDGAIVNTAAVVEHDVLVGAWTHVAPRALLCGGVRVGAGSLVGAGAVIRQGLSLGAATLVGAGAVVVADFEAAGQRLVGVPARVMERQRKP